MEKSFRGLSLREWGAEPFRLFFPAAVLAGLMGVAVWPLHFGGMLELYPGAAHARLMAHGFFGGFIFGFLGTALPRMLGADALSWRETGLLLGLHLLMAGLHALGFTAAGGWVTGLLAAVMFLVLAPRFLRRQDLPPPGFVLVGLAFLCLGTGLFLNLAGRDREWPFFWGGLERLLLYQGFVLLPVLGVGGFILPRFFGLENQQDLPASREPGPEWKRKTMAAAGAGGLVLGSFVLEAAGWWRSGHALRLLVTAGYLLRQVPMHRTAGALGPFAKVLRGALLLLLIGFLAVVLFPEFRVGWLHLTLIGGLGMVTLSVATRVIFGHSGNPGLLEKRAAWIPVSFGLMLLGMATRISGDFWPKILVSHYNYGALLWGGGVLVWAYKVLPKVLQADREG